MTYTIDQPFPFGDTAWAPGTIVNVTSHDYGTERGTIAGRMFAGGEMMLVLDVDGESLVLSNEDIVAIEAAA